MNIREAIAQRALSLVGCWYIYGGTGFILTAERIERQAKQYPEYAEKMRKYCYNHIGVPAYDCAQLTKAAARAVGITLPSGATSQWKSGVFSQTGGIATLPQNEPGIQLFIEKSGKMQHTGVTVGGGYAVEARGHAYGVVRTKITSRGWTHWARYRACEAGLTGVMPAPVMARGTLRKGAQGQQVTELQEILLRSGYGLPLHGADGKFGAETERMLRLFQADHGLTVDGVAGPATWSALLLVGDGVPDEGEAPDEESTPNEGAATGLRYQVTIAGLTREAAESLATQWPSAAMEQEDV